MVTIPRAEIRDNPTWSKMLDIIVRHHVVEPDTIAILTAQADVKNFTETRKCFGTMGPFHFSYVVDSQLVGTLPDLRVQIIVDSITVYDDESEYKLDRTREPSIQDMFAMTNLSKSHNKKG